MAKIVEYILSLNAQERKEFQSLSAASSFNTHQATYRAVVYLCGLKILEDFSRRALFHEIYPSEKFDDSTTSNLLSYVMKLFKRFIQVKSIVNDKEHEQLAFLNFLLEKGHNRRLKREIAKIDPAHSSLNHWASTNRIADTLVLKENAKPGGQFLTQTDHAITEDFIIEKMKLACELQSRGQLLGADSEVILLNPILEYISKSIDNLSASLLARIYYHIFHLIHQTDDVAYNELKRLLSNHHRELKISRQIEFYDYLQNYIIRQINTGNTSYLNELFLLYQLLLEKGLILHKGHLTQWEYKNIVTVGCRIQAFDWTGDFIKNYKAHLIPSVRENAYLFNLASYYNSMGQHEQVLEYLKGVKFSDVFYHLNVNVLLVKTYFALGEYELMRSFLDTFRIFVLRSDKVSGYQEKLYKNFIRYSNKMGRLFEIRDVLNVDEFRQKLDRLKSEIGQKRNTIAFDWLVSREWS